MPAQFDKRSWVIALDRQGHGDGPAHTEGLASFFACDETLARRYADELWPAVRGGTLLVMPADGVENGLRSRARLRFLFDCDLAAHRFAFVEECRGGGAGVCLFCGCTNDNACPGGCWWVTPQLCSACCQRAGIVPEQRSAFELAADPGEVDLFPPQLTFPPDPDVARHLRAACFALYAGDLQSCAERLHLATCKLKPFIPQEAVDDAQDSTET